MKLVFLMYLEEDQKCVDRLLKERQISAFSRIPVEGHGPGSAAGWSGEIQPYDSQIIMTVVEDAQAEALVRAVGNCTGVEDPRHPIRAVLMNVEQFTCCEVAQS